MAGTPITRPNNSTTKGSKNPVQILSVTNDTATSKVQQSNNNESTIQLASFPVHGTFQCISKGQQVSSLEMFHTHIETYCKSAIMSIVIQAMWLWVIMSCYTEIAYETEPIKQNSLNAGYFKMSGTRTFANGQKTVEHLFAKVQLNESADDLIVDCVNGSIINSIVGLFPHIRPNVMQYIESSFVYISSVGTTNYVELRKNGIPATLSDVERLWQLFASNTENMKKVCFQKAIQNSRTLFDVIEQTKKEIKLKEGQVNTYQPIDTDNARKLHALFGSMQVLGKYGFTHHDAHLDNIIYDDEAQSFVLIDYGRACFYPPYMVNPYINEFVEYEVLKLGNPSHPCNTVGYVPKSYEAFIDPARNHDVYSNTETMIVLPLYRYISQYDHILVSNLYLFDVMTITMNMIKNGGVPDEIKQQKIYYYTDSKTVVVEDHSNIAKMIACVHINNTFQYWHLYLPGLYWFSLYMKYCTSVNEEWPPKSGQLKLDIQRGVFAYLHKSFQSKHIVRPRFFVEYMQHNQGSTWLVQEWIQRGNIPEQHRGGAKRTAPKSAAKSTIYKKVHGQPKKHFAEYMGGYLKRM